MNPSYIVPILLIFIVLMQNRNNRFIAEKIIKNKRKKRLNLSDGRNEMTELAKRFVGKDCVIYTYNGGQLIGRVVEVGESGIMLLCDGDENPQLINTDFILRLREHPKNKKGKKKSVILD